MLQFKPPAAVYFLWPTGYRLTLLWPRSFPPQPHLPPLTSWGCCGNETGVRLQREGLAETGLCDSWRWANGQWVDITRRWRSAQPWGLVWSRPGWPTGTRASAGWALSNRAALPVRLRNILGGFSARKERCLFHSESDFITESNFWKRPQPWHLQEGAIPAYLHHILTRLKLFKFGFIYLKNW